MTKNYESGRSMVEMLGTLAIIGVLSVGAIAGYSYGMDKYRANETINDVMLLGVDVITQASRTGGIPNLSAEWGTKTTVGYDFTVVPNPEDETQYGIRISGVPARVCKMVGDALKPMASVYVNDDEHITEEDPCDESDNNTMEFYFEPITTEFGECKTDADCGTDKYCDMGLCFNGNKPEVSANIMGGTCTSDADCNQGWTGTNCAYCDATYGCVEDFSRHNKSCTLTDGNVAGKCGGGQCNPSGCTYDTNKCGKKEYCASPNTYATSNCKAFYYEETGMCVPVNTTFSKIPGTEYYISNGPISWWDGDAGCKALGFDGMAETSDLINGWNGGYDSNPHDFTDLGQTIRTHLSTSYKVWTSNISASSCRANRVSLSDGRVEYSYADTCSLNYCAVCKPK